MSDTTLTTKQNIEQSIKSLSNNNFLESAKTFLNSLGYYSDKTLRLSPNNFIGFSKFFDITKNNFNEEKACVKDWNKVDIVFQLSDDDLSTQSALFETKRIDNKIIQSFLFIAIQLRNETYNRSTLAKITREVNKLTSMPAIILFKYNGILTISIINRRLHKRNEDKDVLEKVTLIKDIDIDKPHRAHLEILYDLSLEQLRKNYAITNFIDLFEAWGKTLDISVLNKKFYKELSNWYFLAVKIVHFPLDNKLFNDQINNSINVIRLLTRIIFVWFLKEKKLVPELFFNKNLLDDIVKFDSDKNNSVYFKAILQNLFFATLNTEMNRDILNNRRFVKDEDNFLKQKDEYGVKSLYRYSDLFKIEKENVVELFDEIPFLNGGLFDCLDKEDENGKINYIDGFTRNKKFQPIVPDFLFFGGQNHVDLSEDYGDAGKKDEEVRGLIEILNSYKFTVAENTPIEEEIALDPELLGKVFESLLASYVPETKTTARKITGSFYTPREIVNYMVDESLLTYLKTKLIEGTNSFIELGSSQTDIFGNTARNGQLKIEEDLIPKRWTDRIAELEDELKKLLSYNDQPHKFNDYEIEILISAIENVKILDPACGSGAFPMGVLLKLVYILHKLDPENEKWKQKQIQAAEVIPDPVLREQQLEQIDDSFNPENNYADYGRKLYLIQRCIFGVDIQPIAVQISKLRFFISLLIDQKENPKKQNRGVMSLPNLETKFVVANTLISRGYGGLFDADIKSQEEKLKKIRDKYFLAKRRSQKLKYISEEKLIRKQIKSILTGSDYDKIRAERLANWSFWDQNSVAAFFDSEWMFGEEIGFDIIIGNPPYSQIQQLINGVGELENENYNTFVRTADIYCLFYERAIRLLKNQGILVFITSNKWLTANYGKNTRRFFIEKTNPLIVIDFGKHKIFENATVFVNILIAQKEKNTSNTKGILIPEDLELKDFDLYEFIHSNSVLLSNLNEQTWKIVDEIKTKIFKRMTNIGKTLSQYEIDKIWDISFFSGIKTGFNEAFHIDKQVKEKIIYKAQNYNKWIKPLLRGKDIKRYAYHYEDIYMLFIPWHFPLHDDPDVVNASRVAERAFIKQYPAIYNHLRQFKGELENRNKTETGVRYEWYALQRYGANYWENFEKEKLVWIEISDRANYAYDDKGMFLTNSAYFLTGENLKYLLAVLNSKISDYYFFEVTAKIAGGRKRYTKQYVEQVPIPEISKKEQEPFVKLVDYVLFLKNESNMKEAGIICNYFEEILNAMVIELYFADRLKENKREIIKHILLLPTISENSSISVRDNLLKEIYQKIYNKEHPIRNSLFYMNTIDEIKEINSIY